MASNLFRYVPSKWITFIKDLKKIFPDEFKKETELIDHVCKILSTFKPLKQVTFDDLANKACRQNNTDVIAKEEAEPTKGGNLTVLQELSQGK